MNGAGAYEHERDRTVHVGEPMPLDLPDHYAADPPDDPDDLRAVRGIALGMGLATVFWLVAGIALWWVLT